MKKKIKYVILGILTIILVACGKAEENNIIYTSLYPLHYFTEEIVGDKLTVDYVGANTGDAHNIELSPKEIARLEDSKGLIINGLDMEIWLKDIKKSIKELNIIDSSQGIEPIKKNKNTFDPHIWLSPKNAIIQSTNIYNAIILIDEDNQEYYKKNYDSLIKRLTVLDEKYTKELKKYNGDTLLVSHEAFGYLAKDYGLNQVSINQIGSEGEPSLKTIKNIIKYMKENDIKTIYTESGESEKIPNAIAKEINGRVEILSTLEHLSIEDINNKENYFSLMEKNLETLVSSLD